MAAFTGKVLSACLAASSLSPLGVAGLRLQEAGTSSKSPRRSGPSTSQWFERVSEIDRTDALLNFDQAKMTHSNLGGMGPEYGEDCITITQAGETDDKSITMKIRIADGFVYDGVVENNVLEGGLLSINVLNGHHTKLDVELLDHTGAPFVLPRFFISVLDIDAGSVIGAGKDASKASGLEDVSFNNVSAYYMMQDARIYAESLGAHDIHFVANQTGNQADNPTSAFHLNDEQLGKAAMVEFHNISNFSMGLHVYNQAGKSGRNFLLTGISPMISAPFGGCANQAYFHIGHANVTQNNLDGKTWGRSQRIVYENAGVIHGTTVDLWVDLVEGVYKPADSSRNGLYGHLGNINMGLNDSATFSFTFVLNGTNTPVALTDFFFSFYDIDQNDGGSESLTISSGVGTYFLSESTSLVATANDDGSVTFASSAYGNDSDNPKAAASADNDEAVTLYFQKPLSTFEITYTTMANGGRNFQFGSMAGIACP